MGTENPRAATPGFSLGESSCMNSLISVLPNSIIAYAETNCNIPEMILFTPQVFYVHLTSLCN